MITLTEEQAQQIEEALMVATTPLAVDRQTVLKALSTIRAARAKADHIAASGKMVAEPVKQKPESVGWYCAHCGRGVDASEVTFHEQHEACGRVITDDVPPKPVKQEPVAWMWACTECGTELEDDDTRKYCNSCGYNKFYKSPRILRQEPVSQEPVAHMYPSDLEKFETNETYAYAYSVAVGNPDERSVPLYTDPPRREWVEPSDEQITKLEYDCFAEICKQDNPTGEKLTALFIRRLLKLSKELNNG